MLTDSNLVGYATFKLLIYTLKAEALSKKRKKKKKVEGRPNNRWTFNNNYK